jgi:hypothetical protein
MYDKKITKNGYEIRADLLVLAKQTVDTDYNNRLKFWEIKDGEPKRMPEPPTYHDIIDIAEVYQEFINRREIRPT